MDQYTQVLLTVSVPTLAVLIGILVNNSRLGDVNKRIDDLRSYIDTRFNNVDSQLRDMKELWRSELHRVEEILDARLKHLEEN